MNKPKLLTVRSLSLFVLAAFLSLASLSCREQGASPNAKRYDLKGKVVAVSRADRRVTISHEEIPGYMEAMTMPFPVRKNEDWVFDILGPGDQVTATLVVDDSLSWIENVVVVKGGTPENASAKSKADNATGASPGEEVPNFTLVNQDAKRIATAQYRGRVLLLTFVYTRCPLPDYCPLMSNNFASVEKELKKDSALYDKTHLLTITIDPEYDTPKVMKSYGGAYTENYTSETFSHWEFATGTPEEVRKVAQYFGLQYNKENEQIIHSLRTAVIAPDGRVFKIYRGNEWKPEEVLRDIQALLGKA